MAKVGWSQTESELHVDDGRLMLTPYLPGRHLYAPGVLQSFLEALPIAAVVVVEGGTYLLPIARNRSFVTAIKQDQEDENALILLDRP